MTRTDRLLISLLALGIWALVLTVNFGAKPAYAASIDVAEIDGLEDFIEQIVEGCRVSGEVYIYDREGGYGELESVSIDC